MSSELAGLLLVIWVGSLCGLLWLAWKNGEMM